MEDEDESDVESDTVPATSVISTHANLTADTPHVRVIVSVTFDIYMRIYSLIS